MKWNVLFKKYKIFILLFTINFVVLFLSPTIGIQSLSITTDNIIEMLGILPPIFILLGLLDVWVEKETMMKLMGPNSGFTGIVIAFLMGSFAAGPLYAAFPIAGVLLKKGSKLSNVLVFIGAWSTTKIPLLLFEASSMGWDFMVLRFILNIPIIFFIAYLTEKSIGQSGIEHIYELSMEED